MERKSNVAPSANAENCGVIFDKKTGGKESPGMYSNMSNDFINSIDKDKKMCHVPCLIPSSISKPLQKFVRGKAKSLTKAGSSGRIPQWEPALPDLHEKIPEVNYTTDVLGNRGCPHSQNPTQQQSGSTNDKHHPGSSPSGTNSNSNNGGGSNGISSSSTNSNNNLSGNNGHGAVFNPKNPVFMPSPVSSKGSSTMYNMDQLTNNIAIPKHTLPNPSNLATSRSTVLDDGGDSSGGSSNPSYGRNNEGSSGGGSGPGEESDRDSETSHHDRFPPPSGNVSSSNHLDGSRGEGGDPYFYDGEAGLSEGSARRHVAQRKRGIREETQAERRRSARVAAREEKNKEKSRENPGATGTTNHQNHPKTQTRKPRKRLRQDEEQKKEQQQNEEQKKSKRLTLRDVMTKLNEMKTDIRKLKSRLTRIEQHRRRGL